MQDKLMEKLCSGSPCLARQIYGKVMFWEPMPRTTKLWKSYVLEAVVHTDIHMYAYMSTLNLYACTCRYACTNIFVHLRASEGNFGAILGHLGLLLGVIFGPLEAYDVCMYVSMNGWMYVCTNVCLSACLFVCLYVCICLYVCMSVCLYVCM